MSQEELGDGLIFERVHEHVEVKVKPCPYCGGPAKTIHVPHEEYGDAIEIECVDCHVHTRECETHEEAAEVWNKRRKSAGKMLCAFCGGKAEYVGADVSDDEHEGMMRIECEECGASTEYYASEKEAAGVWSRRV